MIWCTTPEQKAITKRAEMYEAVGYRNKVKLMKSCIKNSVQYGFLICRFNFPPNYRNINRSRKLVFFKKKYVPPMSMAIKIFPTSSGMYIRETVAGSDL